MRFLHAYFFIYFPTMKKSYFITKAVIVFLFCLSNVAYSQTDNKRTKALIKHVCYLADDKLEACLTDRATAQGLVAWFQSNVERDGISSTPSFLIDGQLHSNMTYSEMSGLIDDALN